MQIVALGAALGINAAAGVMLRPQVSWFDKPMPNSLTDLTPGVYHRDVKYVRYEGYDVRVRVVGSLLEATCEGKAYQRKSNTVAAAILKYDGNTLKCRFK